MSAYVYIHKFPDGKCYIGSTTCEPEKRWQDGGHGYDNQQKMKEAIAEHGWDCIEHLAIQTPDEDVARELESILIRMLDTVDNGYNSHPGPNDKTFFELMYYKGLYEHSKEMLDSLLKCYKTCENIERLVSRSKSEYDS